MTSNSKPITGISCDEPECDYVDPTIELSEYHTQINRPCPACGASLLDEEDYAKIQILLEILNIRETTPESTMTIGVAL